MADYDFKQLSSYDFEILIRDLLQEEFELTIESFKSGRDNGIDLRYARGEQNELIVQCKHYANSSFKDLKGTLKKEVCKVQNLKCNRYILVTSLGLTPGNKDEILKILKPYCKSTSDILGREDVNNLLTKFKDIERENYKLWLTSTNIMERILHSGVYNQSQIEIQLIMDKSKFYVQNKSYFTAKNVLKELNYCIISGIPGIGKTTLAEILILHYLSKGYEVIKIENSIKEAFEVYNPSKLQLFYYDDFLGQTTLKEKLGKNEDSQILKFIDVVNNSNKSKFILTTREYILNQAKQSYEKIANSNFDVKKCTISLEDYTKFHKAQILYNHLYFSKLPKEYKEELLENKNYKKIIVHRNYNPRIIEWMTVKYFTNSENNKYVDEFISILDNPQKLWSHIFDYQLSVFSKNLLLVLTTMPDRVLLKDLEKAFWYYHIQKATIYNYISSETDFRNALKELDGTFINSQNLHNQTYILFSNPSVRDFLESFILKNNKESIYLLDFSIYFEQPHRIYLLQFKERGEATKIDNNYSKKILCSFEKNIISKPIALTADSYNNGKFTNSSPSRLNSILEIMDKNNLKDNELVKRLLKIIIENLRFRDLEDLFSLIHNVKNTEIKSMIITSNMAETIKKTILVGNYDEDINDFYVIILFQDYFSNYLDEFDIDILRERFEEFCRYDVDEQIGNVDYCEDLKDYRDSLVEISNFFGVNVNTEMELLENEIEILIEKEKLGYPDNEDDEYMWDGSDNIEYLDDSVIDNMFDTMLME